MSTEIEAWYGDGNRNPLGPLKATLLEDKGAGNAEVLITDQAWIDHVGYNEGPFTVTCSLLPLNRFVTYDGYAWCPKGAGGEGNWPWK